MNRTLFQLLIFRTPVLASFFVMFAIFGLAVQTAFAQAGALDTPFPSNRLEGANNSILPLVVQSDGKVVIGGFFTSVNGAPRGRIARLNADGTLDAGFGNGLTGANGVVEAIAVQPDGKVVIGGNFTTVNGVARGCIARLNSDGTLDTGFGDRLAGTNTTVKDLAVQPDGKVVIGGQFTTVNGTARPGIARLNADGTTDTTFGNGLTGTNFIVEALAVQPDGKVVIGGSFTTVNDTPRNRIARLNADGTTDTTFGNGLAGVNNNVFALAVQPDGKVVIGGFFTSVNGTQRNRIARLNADGTTDTAFGNGMEGTETFVLAIAVQPDGKVVIGGSFRTINGTARNRIGRLNSDGTLDSGFGLGLSGADSPVRAIAIQPDGKVVIGGDFLTVNGTARTRLARLNADGQTDATFGNDLASGANNFVLALAIQPDGKVVIGGGFAQVNGTARNGIARLHADGTLDTGFGNGLTGVDNPVAAIAVQPDGKVIIGGDFSTVNGTARTRIARLNADGTTDTTFGDGLAGANNSVSTISVQPDGKVVIGGQFTQVNDSARNGIARLNTDGTLDTGFGNGLTGANGSVRASSVQSDGKVVIGGLFTSINGESRGRIARFLADPCANFTLNPTSVNVAAAATNGTVGLTALNTGCPWTATSNASWLTITGGAAGTGNGTVTYGVAANSGPARTGTLTIAGQTFSVTQEGCIFPTAFNVTGGGSFCSGGTGVAVGLSNSETGVNYQLFNGASPVGGPVAGTGSALNFGIQTTGGTYTVVGTNATAGCSTNMTGSATGTVTNCQPAVTTNPATGVSPTGATLNGLVNANGDSTTVLFRFGTTAGGPYPNLIAGTPSPVTGTTAVSAVLTGLATNQIYYFVVEGSNVSGTAQGAEQSFSTATCSFELSASSASFPASGGNGSVTLTTTAGCAWTVADLPDWIVNVSPSNGTATTAITYTVNPNLSQDPRSATLTIGGQRYQVTQSPSVQVNSSIGLAITGQTVLPTSCAPNYANDYVITATLTNTGSQAIYNPHLRLLELQEAAGSPAPVNPFRLVTADGATCATGGLVGAIQSTDGQLTPATLPTLAPGQSVTVRLVIALPSLRRFRLIFGVDGSFVGPVAMKNAKGNFAKTFTLARQSEVSTGTALVFIPNADGKTMNIVPVQPELEAFLNLGDDFWADMNRTLEPHRAHRSCGPDRGFSSDKP